MEEENYQGVYTNMLHINQSRNSDIVKLDLSCDLDLTNLDLLRFFPNLRDLDLSNCINLGDNYQAIKYLTKLESLNMYNVRLTTAEYLVPLQSLKKLYISLPVIGDAVDYLIQLPKLEELKIYGKTNGIEKIGLLTGLKILSLNSVFNDANDYEEGSEVPTLDFLASLTNLRELDLSCNDFIYSIEPITILENLICLNLSDNSGIEKLGELKNLVSLEILNISSMNGLKYHIRSFAALPNIRKVILNKHIDIAQQEFSDHVEISKF